ncbi:MAG: peptidoglycan DD-metalloendopeptidase family protein [Lachnospiraceae bacterium]|nr:peptidoglycan DD-metalloendopeptidase family protein [Lachnospiraceae bacterium]
MKLLNMTLNASWLILAVMLLRIPLKKAPKWASCMLWGIVAFRLVCPLSFQSVLSLLPSGEVIPESIMTDPHIYSGIRVIDNAVNPVVSQTMAPDPGSSVNPMQVAVFVMGCLWITGAAAMVVYALISFLMLKRKVRVSAPVAEGVYECDEVRSPFILGILRPVIYVPSGMDKEMYEYVTAHERAHLKRRDHLWKPLGYLILSVYWFNPLCWIAYVLLCRDIEAACDEKVIRDKDRDYMAAYSQALLNCSIRRRSIAACPVAFGETDVKSRVRGILNYRKPAFWIIMTSLMACVAVAACFATDPKRTSVNAASSDGEELPVVTVTDEETAGDSEGQVIDRVYAYSGNTGMTEDGQWIDFTISLNSDGAYTWYESPVSSYIGCGKYTIEDGILTLNDDPYVCTPRVNRFRIEGDSLFFIEEGSDNFLLVSLKDGEEFVTYHPEEEYGAEVPVADNENAEGAEGSTVNAGDVTEGDEQTVSLVLGMPYDSFIITRGFDAETHPETDICGEEGTPVYAVCAGTVTDAFFDAATGNTVILKIEIEGMNAEIRYSHLDDMNVAPGDVVTSGDVIGTLGNTGRSTGPHLGIMLTLNGTPVDITDYLPEEN